MAYDHSPPAVERFACVDRSRKSTRLVALCRRLLHALSDKRGPERDRHRQTFHQFSDRVLILAEARAAAGERRR